MYVGNIRQWLDENQTLPAQLQPWLARLAKLAEEPQTTGRHVLDDVNYYNVDETVTEVASARQIEAHRQYIDIQFVLSGNEYIGWQPLCCSGSIVESHPERDIWFYDGAAEKDAKILMTPGTFAVFFPYDGHRPLCAPDGQCGPVRKIIMKIHV